MNTNPIGVFDSGVGGLSVLRHLLTLLPNESFVYFADQAYVPYGGKSAETIRTRSKEIIEFLVNEKECKLIVIACNTATTAALTWLRGEYPNLPIVGMEPAVKPGARATQTGKVGVLATAGTFRSERYADLMQRFAQDVEVLEDPCVGLVSLIENGLGDSDEANDLLQTVLTPMLAQNVDTVVLGCTHYPFVEPQITRIVGEDVTIIDPAPAVARQTQRVLHRYVLTNNLGGEPPVFLTSGDSARFQQQIEKLIGNVVSDL